MDVTNDQSRITRIGSTLSTATSTTMTVALMASLGAGFFGSLLMACAGLGFELLKWSSWKDAWSSHYSGKTDRRNILAILCGVSVVLSVAASVATARSGLAENASGYLEATQQKEMILSQIEQRQKAIDICLAANRVSLCAKPIQKEVSRLQSELKQISIPSPDEATALVSEVSTVTGLAFKESATAVIGLISIMLDASGLYFLFLGISSSSSQVVEPVKNNIVEVIEAPKQENIIHLSVTLGVDETISRAWDLIESQEIKPSVRNLAEKLEVPNHASQAILYWLAESGKIQRTANGRGYTL